MCVFVSARRHRYLQKQEEDVGQDPIPALTHEVQGTLV